jgi:hypothetical protein
VYHLSAFLRSDLFHFFLEAFLVAQLQFINLRYKPGCASSSCGCRAEQCGLFPSPGSDVGLADGRQALGDDKGGAPLSSAFQRFLDQVFGLRIHAGSRVVHDQDARVHQEGAAIATRWRCPPERVTPRSPTTGFVAFGHFHDKVMRLGGFGGFDDFSIGSARAGRRRYSRGWWRRTAVRFAARCQSGLRRILGLPSAHLDHRPAAGLW